MTVTSLVIGGGAGGGLVGVPNVVGLQQADAEAKLRDFELVPKAQTIEAEGAEGTVFSQNPAANSARPKRTVVTLLIIKSPVIPPNLDQQLTDIKNAVADVSTQVTGVDGKADGLNLKLDEIITTLTDLGTTADTISTKLDGVDAKVDGVGLAVSAVDGKVDSLTGTVDGLVTKADEIATAVAATETDTAAETRLQTILDKLDEEPEVRQGAAAKRTTGTGRGGPKG